MSRLFSVPLSRCPSSFPPYCSICMPHPTRHTLSKETFGRKDEGDHILLYPWVLFPESEHAHICKTFRFLISPNPSHSSRLQVRDQCALSGQRQDTPRCGAALELWTVLLAHLGPNCLCCLATLPFINHFHPHHSFQILWNLVVLVVLFIDETQKC